MSLRYGMTTWAEIHAANKDLQVRVKELDELIECEQCDKKASGYTVCPSCWNELGARVKELEAELQRYKDYVADCDVLDDYDVEPDSKREEEQR